jgi:hypothetical protein
MMRGSASNNGKSKKVEYYMNANFVGGLDNDFLLCLLHPLQILQFPYRPNTHCVGLHP